MPRAKSKHPTELELEILKILWRGGAKSGRQIRDELEPDRKVTYTSVMTILGIMEEKKYVRRKKQGGSFVYSARIGQAATLRRMLRDVVERLFEGSTAAAMVNLLDVSDIDAEQLREIRKVIQEKEREQS